MTISKVCLALHHSSKYFDIVIEFVSLHSDGDVIILTAQQKKKTQRDC